MQIISLSETDDALNPDFLRRRYAALRQERRDLVLRSYPRPIDHERFDRLNRQIAYAEAEMRRLGVAPIDDLSEIRFPDGPSEPRQALGAIGRGLTAFAIRAAFGNPWAWATIFAAFMLIVWLSYTFGGAASLPIQ